MLAVSHERSRTGRYRVQGDRCCLAQVFGGDPCAAETMPGGGQNQAAKLPYWFPAMLRVGLRLLVLYNLDTGRQFIASMECVALANLQRHRTNDSEDYNSPQKPSRNYSTVGRARLVESEYE